MTRDWIFDGVFWTTGLLGLVVGSIHYVVGMDLNATAETAAGLASFSILDRHKLARRVAALEDAARRDAMDSHLAEGER